MAEERLIDDDEDKDKKIRIVAEGKDSKFQVVTDENGEEELLIHETPEEEEQGVMQFEIPEDLVEDEELADLSGEQLAEAMRRKEEEEKQRLEKVADFTQKAHEALNEGKFATSMEYITSAEDYNADSSDIRCMKLTALTQAYADFSETEQIMKAAADVTQKGSEEDKAALKAKYYTGLKKSADTDMSALEKIKEENEAGKEERRQILAPQKKAASIRFYISLAVFVVFAAVAIGLSTRMFSMENALMLVLTIVFAAIAVVCLVVFVVFTRFFITACQMYSKNEKDTSTKVGREQIALTAVYNAKLACLGAMEEKTEEVAEDAKKAETADTSEE